MGGDGALPPPPAHEKVGQMATPAISKILDTLAFTRVPYLQPRRASPVPCHGAANPSDTHWKTIKPRMAQTSQTKDDLHGITTLLVWRFLSEPHPRVITRAFHLPLAREAISGELSAEAAR